TVVLRPRVARAGARGSRAAARDAMSAASRLPEHRRYVSREEFALGHGADPADMAKVEAFAREHSLTVVEASAAKRTIRLAGTIADLTAAFRPNLKRSKVGTRVVRTRTGGVSVPVELGNIVLAILGFDDRPAARPHSLFRGRATVACGPAA